MKVYQGLPCQMQKTCISNAQMDLGMHRNVPRGPGGYMYVCNVRYFIVLETSIKNMLLSQQMNCATMDPILGHSHANLKSKP